MALPILLKIIGRCFGDEMATSGWQVKFREMIPSFGRSLTEDAALSAETKAHSAEVLELRVDRPLVRATGAQVS